MDAAKLREVGNAPVLEVVASRERFEDPDVDGKCFEPAGPEKQHAVRDLFADAGKFTQSLFRDWIRRDFSFFQPPRMRREKTGRFRNVAGAKSQQASAQFGFGNFRQFRPRGKAVEAGWCCELRVRR